MYCDRCGTELQPEQRFCSSCGKAVGASVPPAPDSRLARHGQLLGILWLVLSGFRLLGAGVLLIIANTLLARIGKIEGVQGIPGFLQPLLSWIGGMLLIGALAGMAAGWGILHRESWARVLALALGFISLLDVPLGTALGIYTIWVLLSPEAGDEYLRTARAA